MSTLPIVAITIGDPAGVGPDVVAAALAGGGLGDCCRPLVIGDRKALERSARVMDVTLPLHPIREAADATYEPGVVDLIDLDNVPVDLAIGKVRQTGPITGGLFLEDDVADLGPGVEFTPDHDQRVVASAGLTWTGARGATISGVWRYESGTPIELDDDELDELAGRPGADLVDFASGRVRSRNTVALTGGLTAWETARAAIRVEAAVLNLFGARYAYNFGNPFSGTHFGAPRTAALTLRVETR